VVSFRDAASLAVAVTKSLRKSEISNAAAPPVPDILPYLCDRSVQEGDLADALSRFDAKANHPLVCLIHGDETEAHDKFLERLQRYMIQCFDRGTPSKLAFRCIAWNGPLAAQR